MIEMSKPVAGQMDLMFHIDISKESIIDILHKALSWEAMRWCNKISVSQNTAGIGATEYCALGGNIYVDTEGNHLLLNKEMIIKGIKMFLANGTSEDCLICKKNKLLFSSEFITSKGADKILQYSLFNEVKYGGK